MHDARLAVRRIDGVPGELEIEARRLMTTGAGVIYELAVTTEGRRLASSRATIVAPRQGAGAE